MTAPLRPTDVKKDPLAVLTQLALVLLLAAVAARVTVSELQSNAFGFGGSAEAAAIGPGPTTTILLNFLCVVPALLVLVRRAIDRAYVTRWHVSYVLAFALAAWITASAIWASNKFDALLYASTWWAAASVLWATGQLVRSWTRLRPVLGTVAGLAMVFLAQGIVYQFYEQPSLVWYWDHDPDLLARRQAEPDSFTLKQMDRAINSGAQQGFFRSANTFAAAAVLAGLVTGGLAIQRLKTRDEPGFAAVLALAAAGTIAVLYWTGSRTAAATAVMAIVALALAWWQRDRLAARPRTVFAIGVIVVLVGVAVVVAIGLKTGELVHVSLTFRWYYWVASFKLFLQHPLLGVGWTNFGSHYLGVRLPIAAEDVRDPHNVFVRFATETGAIGLLLAIAWVARSLWEVTRPVSPKTAAAAPQHWVRPALAIAAIYWLLRMAVLWPLTVAPAELSKTVLFALLLLTGVLLSTVRNHKDANADDRPAPFLLYAAVVALLAFLLHNQVDFALSETGPLLLFMLVLGALLGVRHPGVAGKTTHTLAALGGLAGAFVALLAAAGLWAVPVILAEAKAAAAEAKGNDGYAAYQTGRQEVATNLMRDSVTLYREAMADTPVANPDYPRRAARWMNGSESKEILAMYGRAITADPADPQGWLDRARFGRQTHETPASVFADYAEFVRRNPTNAPGHLEFAQALDAAGDTTRATEQYAAALAVNDALKADEPRRLPTAQVEQIKRRLGK